jgi:hypothetical protein
MMLQRVAVGQVRFNLPGLSADARGVVGGKQLAVRFAAIDRLVSFFRVLSAEQSLDDLQPGLRIAYARGAAGTREAVVLVPAGSTHLGDVVARAARLAGGQSFTGTGKHFVQFRDARAPLGYDAAGLSDEPGDLVLYGAEQVVAYRIESELPLAKLLLRLSLQRLHGETTLPPDGVLYLTARRALGPLVAEYLHRAQAASGRAGSPHPNPLPSGEGKTALRASVALCEASEASLLAPGSAFWLFRIESVPSRMRDLLTGTPGLELFTPVNDNVVVSVGYRHPIHLEACRGSFPADRFFLFSPRGEGVTVVSPAPALVAVEDVVRIRAPRARDPERSDASPGPRPDVAVPLRLERSAEPRRRPVAALVPWQRVSWLQRLCYALPPTALRGYRVALLERGVLLLAADVLEGFPFGVLLDAAAPDVLVPLGTRVRPAVSPVLLAERVGAAGGALVVFPGLGETPFRVPAHAIEPLDRRVLAAVELGAAEPTSRPRYGEPLPGIAVEIQNDPLGPMPLWGLER